MNRHPSTPARAIRPGEQRWRAVHSAGDRNPPIVLSDRRKRQPSGTSTSVWKHGKSDGAVYE